jgi:hypothetical protein
LLVKLKPCQMIFLEDENTLGWGDFWSSTCNKHPTLLIISSKQYTYIILYKLYIYIICMDMGQHMSSLPPKMDGLVRFSPLVENRKTPTDF